MKTTPFCYKCPACGNEDKSTPPTGISLTAIVLSTVFLLIVFILIIK